MSDQVPSQRLQSEPLLATRFFIPRLPAARVFRPRLLKRLDEGLQMPLLLISASAGFGKTSLVGEWLVSEWAHPQSRLRSSWLALEAADNDWMRFFRYLVAAWQHIFPDAGETALAELDASEPPQHEVLLSLLLNDLLAEQRSVDAADTEAPQHSSHALLVLDDYHRVDDPAIHKSVTYLIEHLPPNCHLAIITRTDPPLPLPRWRSGRQMLEIRMDDLRFTPGEAEEFLNQTMQVNLTEEQMRILEARTEGWIVGLQLAALALQNREDPEVFVKDFDGSHRYVLDYLVEEVVNQQPGEIQQFLLTTAPMEQFCAPLCGALLYDTPSLTNAVFYSQHILEQLERSNLFLIPLDDHRGWFRYHHLFADLLQARLLQTHPERLPILYRRAALWFMENQLWREAIVYAQKTGDLAFTADLLEQAVLQDGFQFLSSAVSSLIKPVPEALVRSRPVLGLVSAAAMIEQSQLKGIEPLLRGVENRLPAGLPDDTKSGLLATVSVLQSKAASLLGDQQWIIESSRRVIELLPNQPTARYNALLGLGNAYFYNGDLNQVDAVWQEAANLCQKNGLIHHLVRVLDDLGRLCGYKGELKRAEELFQRALSLQKTLKPYESRGLAGIQRDWSDLLRERNCLEEARAMMASSIGLAETWEDASAQGSGYLYMGRICLAQGDRAAAGEMLERVERLIQEHTIYPDLTAAALVFRSRLFLLQNETEKAWKVLEEGLRLPCCQHPFHREWVQIAQARVLIRRNQPGDALQLLKNRRADAILCGRGQNWLEMSLLTAEALFALGQMQPSLAVLEEGLIFGQKEGLIRTFVDEGAWLGTLLDLYQQISSNSPINPYIHTLLSAIPKPAGEVHASSSTHIGLVESLSERELEVLHLLCAGFSNQEIAGRLVLSVGTVKTHIHHIFGKLGVRDRPQAIAKAAQLGL